MEIKDLYKERSKIIKKFKDDKEKLRINLKADLDVIDKQIKGQKTVHSNSRAKTVKEVMGQVNKGGRIKPDTYNWNKVQPIKKKEEKK